MIELKINLVHPNAKMPTKGSEHAAAWDVYAADYKMLSSHKVEYDLGFQLEFPENYKLILIPRSSISNTQWLFPQGTGLGDADYRGTYKFRFTTSIVTSSTEIPYQIGDRIGQIYLQEIVPIQFNQVSELSDTVRGSGGFGSSGRN